MTHVANVIIPAFYLDATMFQNALMSGLASGLTTLDNAAEGEVLGFAPPGPTQPGPRLARHDPCRGGQDTQRTSNVTHHD